MLETNVYNLEPKAVFYHFAEISKIPRGSGNEKAISNYLVNFAKERGFEVEQDKALNVIIRKPASPGYENAPSVMLQGHIDMVCEKTADSPHDFTKDPIKLIIKGDELYADRTTLGGDDGIAVAYALAILEDKSIKHPALEIVLTTSEETGMDGVMALTREQIRSKTVLNIDSEEEGVFLTSCAGGANVLVEFASETEATSGELAEICVSGLTGGHSGMEIVKQRANALKVLGRMLEPLVGDVDFRIVSIKGGSKHNAIATSAEAIVSLKQLAKDAGALESLASTIQAEYKATDPKMSIQITKLASDCQKPVPKTMFSHNSSVAVAEFMVKAPDGMQQMSKNIAGLVESSLNHGVLEEGENRKLSYTLSVRSSVKAQLDSIIGGLMGLAEKAGAKATKQYEYPAWEYRENSRVRDIAVKTWQSIYNQTPEITAIHAGLECGTLNSIIDDMDAISLGPNMKDVHTPNEHLNIPSVNRVWVFLKALLENLK